MRAERMQHGAHITLCVVVVVCCGDANMLMLAGYTQRCWRRFRHPCPAHRSSDVSQVRGQVRLHRQHEAVHGGVSLVGQRDLRRDLGQMSAQVHGPLHLLVHQPVRTDLRAHGGQEQQAGGEESRLRSHGGRNVNGVKQGAGDERKEPERGNVEQRRKAAEPLYIRKDDASFRPT